MKKNYSSVSMRSARLAKVAKLVAPERDDCTLGRMWGEKPTYLGVVIRRDGHVVKKGGAGA
jgi:hypothetical protein